MDTGMTEKDKKEFQREILFSFWKIHILRHAGEHAVYGQWMLKELRRHGYDVSPGSLYPIFHRMCRFGWLAPVKEEGLRTRSLYTLTPKGRMILDAATAMLGELRGSNTGQGIATPE